MSNPVSYPHIERRSDGKYWLTGTQIKVLEVALDRLAHHWDADEIQRQHPHLTLGQIYSCLAFYYDHQEEMDRMIIERLESIRQFQTQQGESVLRLKLKARGCRRVNAAFIHAIIRFPWPSPWGYDSAA